MHTSDKELLSKIEKELLQVNNKKWPNDINSHFSKRYMSGWLAPEKILNIANHQRIANSDHNVT
jgi:hypothetical protein